MAKKNWLVIGVVAAVIIILGGAVAFFFLRHHRGNFAAVNASIATALAKDAKVTVAKVQALKTQDGNWQAVAQALGVSQTIFQPQLQQIMQAQFGGHHFGGGGFGPGFGGPPGSGYGGPPGRPGPGTGGPPPGY